VSYLFDTNVLSEIRKKQRRDPNVDAFAATVDWDTAYTSWIVVAELRRGALLIRRHDPKQADAIDDLTVQLLNQFGDRVLPVDQAVAEAWPALMVPNPRSPMDSLIAATALAHGLTLVTRNIRDFLDTGIDLIDPWSFTGQ
jgi:predicted nucleic acid-binding protein